MATQHLITYQDLIEHLVTRSQGGAYDPEQRDIRQAIQEGYDDVQHGAEWTFLMAPLRIALHGAVSSSTIAYDHTGGTYERMVTLASGSWPTWAAQGTLKIGNATYLVDTYESSTQLTLREDSNPGADVASGTSYILYQSSYALPANFKVLRDVYVEGDATRLSYVNPREWFRQETQVIGSGSPSHFTVMGSSDEQAGLSLRVFPYPDADGTLVGLYQRRCRDLYYTGMETEATAGTVSGSAGSASVAGSGSAFAAEMVGSVIRFSRNTTTLPTARGGLNPYREQRVIKTRGSTTAITLTESLTYTHASSTLYVVSDPIDLDPTLLSVLRRACEWRLTQYRSPGKSGDAERNYVNELLLARERNNKVLRERAAGGEAGPLLVFPEVGPQIP